MFASHSEYSEKHKKENKMKKILMIAFVVMASAAFAPAMAQSKKEKKQKGKKAATEMADCCREKKGCDKKEGECCKKIPLISASDSLSYAVGMNVTDGLMPFISQNFDVDPQYIDDVMVGYREGLAKADDKKFMARAAGVQVANMVRQRIMPTKEAEYKNYELGFNKEMFQQGFAAAVLGDTAMMTIDKAKALENSHRQKAHDAATAAVKAEGQAFLAENAKKEGVVTLPSGLQYKVLREGTGKIPTINDNVVVKYEGTLIDGTKFDSSYDRDPQTTTFKPSQVIKGWTEALTMMPVGSKWMLFIPENLAYGERQAGSIPPFSTLIFTVELEEIK